MLSQLIDPVSVGEDRITNDEGGLFIIPSTKTKNVYFNEENKSNHF